MASNKQIDEIKQDVKQIIIDLVRKDKGLPVTVDQLSDTEDISYSTLLQMSSLMAIRMIVEFEKFFDIEVPDEDLDLKNFKNVEVIAHYIQGRLAN